MDTLFLMEQGKVIHSREITRSHSSVNENVPVDLETLLL